MKKILQKPIILVIFIIIGLILFNAQGYLEPVKDIFFQITSPFQKITYQISLKISNFISLLERIKELDEENIRCREENQRLKGAAVELKEIVQENEFLRQQLNLNIPEKRNLVLANVIGQDPTNLGKFLLIDKGQRDGVKQGAVVIIAGNLLVGRITQASTSSAKVLLITHASGLVNALIQESRVRGIIRGGPGLSLTMDWIPQQEKIEPGQTVVTSGLAGLFPKGLLIGQIEKVISNETQVFQKATVKPVVDFQRLERVFVIIQ
jgi:rod shape-determining protein MreC